MSEIQERVIEIIAEQLDKEASEIKPESNLLEDLSADSLDIVELSMTIKDKFGLNIKLKDELPAFHTVGDVVKFVEEKVANDSK